MTKASLFFWTVSEMVIMFLLAFLVIFVYESNHVCVKISWVSLHFSYSIHLDLCHTQSKAQKSVSISDVVDC